MTLKEFFPAATKKKLAVVGMYRGTRELAPWDDEDYDIWCLNNAYQRGDFVKRATMWWDIHDDSVIHQNIHNPNHAEVLAAMDIPIMMQEVYPDIPNSIRYPIEAVIAEFGTKYISSSFALQAIAAYAMGYERVEFYGYTMKALGDYFKQRPNAEYWLGRLKERGFNFYFPEDCDILRGDFYAYEDTIQSVITSMNTRILKLTSDADKAFALSLSEEGKMLILAELKSRGVSIPEDLEHSTAVAYQKALTDFHHYSGQSEEAKNLQQKMMIYGGHRG